MSTRRGQTVELEEVLNEAIVRAQAIIEKSETGRGLTGSEKEDVAKAVGIGAIKYFDLMHHPRTDIIFDWEKIFVLEGNSAPYLQYTLARANSVLAKGKEGSSKAGKLNNEEMVTLRSLAQFSEIIVTAAKSYSPNILANYLFNLAQKYNNFYNQHRIIGGENQDFRFALTSGVRQVLKNGLTLLGIETPERM
jgi:arginyl-tRNA synthetase